MVNQTNTVKSIETIYKQKTDIVHKHLKPKQEYHLHRQDPEHENFSLIEIRETFNE